MHRGLQMLVRRAEQLFGEPIYTNMLFEGGRDGRALQIMLHHTEQNTDELQSGMASVSSSCP